jgi:hypothetical protein
VDGSLTLVAVTGLGGSEARASKLTGAPLAAAF